MSFSGSVVTVGWCGDILLSYYSFLFPPLLCYPFTWFTLALSMEVFFFSAMLVFSHQTSLWHKPQDHNMNPYHYPNLKHF